MIATLSKKLFEKIGRKGYRDEYVAEGVRTGIAYQVRALRDQRGWSQKALSAKLGKPQSVVSRIEDPDYGKLSVQTLLELASAFDVALVIKFVSFPEFLWRTKDVSPTALGAESFDEAQFHPMDQAGVSHVVTQSRIGAAIFIDVGTQPLYAPLTVATGRDTESIPYLQVAGPDVIGEWAN